MKLIVKAISLPPVLMEQEEVREYLGSGAPPAFIRKRLNRMKREPMTAKKIDEIRDRAEVRLAERKGVIQNDSFFGVTDSSELVIRRFGYALELYGNLIRNLEFVDRSVKREHLEACFELYHVIMRGVLGDHRQLMLEVRAEIEEISDGDEVIARINDEDVSANTIVDYIESILKSSWPAMMSKMAYDSIGSEKISEILIDYV